MQLNLLISDLLSFQEILNPDNAVFIVICICHYSNLIMVSNFFLQVRKKIERENSYDVYVSFGKKSKSKCSMQVQDLKLNKTEKAFSQIGIANPLS